MRKILILTIGVVLTTITMAQAYVSASFSTFNGTGTFSERAMPTLEVGRTINAFSVGVAIGRTSFAESGKIYIEARPTLTIFTKDNFSASGTIGVGYIFDSGQNFLTEYCGTMSYAFKRKWSASLFAGGYKFEGKNLSTKYTFIGTGLTYTL